MVTSRRHALISQAKWYRVTRDILLLLAGGLITAMAINVFYVPIKLTMGGISGIVSIIYQLTGRGEFLSFGLMFIILNIPLLIMGYFMIGLQFVSKSVIGTLVYSVIIDLTEPMMSGWYTEYINRPLASGGADPLIYCLFGGALYGIGLGMIFRGGFTTGGTDIIAMLVRKRIKIISMGQILMIMDALIVFASAIAYRHGSEPSILLAMYSFIAMYLTAKSIDILLEGFDYCRTAYIISDKSEEIAQQILTKMERGVTSLRGEGMYTRKTKDVLLCVLSRKQVPDVKQIVEQIDPDAFVIVTEAREVLGEGFSGSHTL